MDAETFKQQYLPHHAKLYRIAFRLLGNRNDAEDIVQEAYIKLWQKRDDLKDVLNTESFAVTVLKNLCLDFLRQHRPESGQVPDILPEGEDSLMEQIENRDRLALVERIVAQLPEQQKRLVQLKHWEGLPDREIEAMTGLKRGNIKVILSRARKNIRLMAGIAAGLALLMASGWWFSQQKAKQTYVQTPPVEDPEEACREAVKALTLVSINFNKGIKQLNMAQQHLEKSNEIVEKHIKIN
jgi:RNA polymerase sigma-70 factor (ECF subfamily)